ncbi:hypothetical protein [Microbacterium sp. nov. GSS16]|uniref:hypothetical protein n=1 Tax=Microbacterium sp. nov. GSS16 TaxID=3019890 RepID=UPI002306CAAB|nr:hypothetical protein [Microbacterium sp. nov. GSS16]WCD92897.1 hypothetical protein PGB26_01050 [Microbacterium sp. nov. GSS16]
MTIGAAKSGVLIRIVDQGFWSAAFFLSNLAIAADLDVQEFAFYSTILAIVLVAVAVNRSAGVDSQIIANARNKISSATGIDRSSVWMTSAGLFLFLFAGILLVSLINRVPSYPFLLSVCVWAGAVLLGDVQHYYLVIMRARFHAALVSILYFVSISTALGVCHWLELDAMPSVAVGAAAHACVAGVVTASARLPSAKRRIQGRLALGLGLESLYVSVGSQLGPLILFAAGLAAPTAGLRLAYSAVYSPVFAVIQALYPLLLLRVLDESVSGSSSRRTMLRWSAFVFISTGAFATIGWVIIPHIELIPLLINSLEFLVPVGLSFVGAQMLEVGLLSKRLIWNPVRMNMLRLASVSLEMVLQVLGVLFAGVDGLIVCMTSIGVLKLALAAWLLRRGGRS